jgi:hypothetical protein
LVRGEIWNLATATGLVVGHFTDPEGNEIGVAGTA